MYCSFKSVSAYFLVLQISVTKPFLSNFMRINKFTSAFYANVDSATEGGSMLVNAMVLLICGYFYD